MSKRCFYEGEPRAFHMSRGGSYGFADLNIFNSTITYNCPHQYCFLKSSFTDVLHTFKFSYPACILKYLVKTGYLLKTLETF